MQDQTLVPHALLNERLALQPRRRREDHEVDRALGELSAQAQQSTQPTSPSDDPSQATSSSTTVSDDIIVTAQRRSANIRDVPISISAISGETVSALTVGGEDIRVLAGRVPNLNVESTFGRVFPRFYIRCVGNSDFTLNSTASVLLYYDDVILENQVLRGMPAFDLERVEVLRGPQETLYGRNSTAGAVKLISKKPTQDLQGTDKFLTVGSTRPTSRKRSAAR